MNTCPNIIYLHVISCSYTCRSNEILCPSPMLGISMRAGALYSIYTVRNVIEADRNCMTEDRASKGVVHRSRDLSVPTVFIAPDSFDSFRNCTPSNVYWHMLAIERCTTPVVYQQK